VRRKIIEFFGQLDDMHKFVNKEVDSLKNQTQDIKESCRNIWSQW